MSKKNLNERILDKSRSCYLRARALVANALEATKRRFSKLRSFFSPRGCWCGSDVCTCNLFDLVNPELKKKLLAQNAEVQESIHQVKEWCKTNRWRNPDAYDEVYRDALIADSHRRQGFADVQKDANFNRLTLMREQLHIIIAKAKKLKNETEKIS